MFSPAQRLSSVAHLWRLGLAALLALAAGAAPAAESTRVSLAYFGAADTSAHRGVRQGIDEGNQQGQFLGRHYELTQIAPEEMKAITPAAAAIIAAVGAEELRLLAELNPGVPVLNIVEGHDDLRALCLPNLLHVYPSDRMKRDAEAQWQKLHPDDTVHVAAWHADFEKYAGRQLNNRYRKSFDEGMDDYAWAGWAATKMVTDAAVRIKDVAPRALLDYLRADLEFDGQKGVTMSFRPNGQLRQVLLIVKGDEIVGEAPVKGAADPNDLDSLGFGHCPGQPAGPPASPQTNNGAP